MRRAGATALLSIGTVLALSLFAACAGSGEEEPPSSEVDAALDGGPAEDGSPSPAEDASTEDAPVADAEALRCSGDLCLVDLPNPGAYGFTRWVFTGIVVDPAIGVWAIANGAPGIDDATAQVLRFDGAGFRPAHAPVIGEGKLRLASLAGDGAGNLLAVGATLDDGTGAIVRGDGTSFTAAPFEASLEAAWFAAPGLAWVAGRGGAIFRATADGEWISEASPSGGDFFAIWGSGPDDVYVGGEEDPYDYPAYGLLGHRTAVAGAEPTWAFSTFPELQTRPFGAHAILAGIARPGARFWAAPDVLARGGEPTWVADPFQPPVAINAFWARADDDIWAVGNVGRIYHFDGTAWKDMLLVFNGAPLVKNLTGIAGTSAGELFIVGDGVALHRRAP